MVISERGGTSCLVLFAKCNPAYWAILCKGKRIRTRRGRCRRWRDAGEHHRITDWIRATRQQPDGIDFQDLALVPEREKTWRHLQLKNVSVCRVGWIQETMPLGRKLLPQIEHAQRRHSAILFEIFPQVRDGSILERTGIFSRRVFDVQNGVGNRAVIELAQRFAEIGFAGSGLLAGRSLNSSSDHSLTAPAPSKGR